MKPKKQLRKLLNKLPSSIDEVNEFLENEEVIMIDFMDGERVTFLCVIEDTIQSENVEYVMMDECCMEIDTVSIDRLKRNSLYS